MKIKVFFGFIDDWFNVIFFVVVQLDEVECDIECGWKRDMDKVVRKMFKDKGFKKVYIFCEIYVVCIFEVLDDGYFCFYFCVGGFFDGQVDEISFFLKCKIFCFFFIFCVVSILIDLFKFCGVIFFIFFFEVVVFVGLKVIFFCVDFIIVFI